MVTLPTKKSLALLPTPFQPLDRLSVHVGGPRIWIKRDDLTGCVLSGNKIRKLEYILHEVERDGVDTLITCGGWNSNHCRAVANVCAQLGLKAHLILRDDGFAAGDGNLLLDDICGAEISVYPAKQYAQELPELFEFWEAHYQLEGRRCRKIPTGGSDGTGALGYLAASYELHSDFKSAKIAPDYIFCASGSGGTQAGLTLGGYLQKSTSQVIGVAVCDSADYFNTKVATDILQWQQNYCTGDFGDCSQLAVASTWEEYIGPGYAKIYPKVRETIRLVGAMEGVVLDPVYTGKAFYAMLDGVRSGRIDKASDIVFVHTGGVFGLFPYKNALSDKGPSF